MRLIMGMMFLSVTTFLVHTVISTPTLSNEQLKTTEIAVHEPSLANDTSNYDDIDLDNFVSLLESGQLNDFADPSLSISGQERQDIQALGSEQTYASTSVSHDKDTSMISSQSNSEKFKEKTRRKGKSQELQITAPLFPNLKTRLSQRDIEWIVRLVGHYWGMRPRKIPQCLYDRVLYRLTPDIASILLDPSTPVEQIVDIAKNLGLSTADPYIVSLLDAKHIFTHEYKVNRKTLERYFKQAREAGYEGYPASIMYQYCVKKWKQQTRKPQTRKPQTRKPQIDFRPYTQWSPAKDMGET